MDLWMTDQKQQAALKISLTQVNSSYKWLYKYTNNYKHPTNISACASEFSKMQPLSI